MKITYEDQTVNEEISDFSFCFFINAEIQKTLKNNFENIDQHRMGDRLICFVVFIVVLHIIPNVMYFLHIKVKEHIQQLLLDTKVIIICIIIVIE
jgi:hypothetical protein